MNESRKGHILQFLFFAAIAVACVAIAVGCFRFRTESHLPGGDVTDLSTGWVARTAWGDTELNALPATVPCGSDGVTLVGRLPQALPENPRLEFYSHQSTVEVLLDGQRIYSYGLTNRAPVGQLLGNVRNVAPLPPDAGGKEVEIRLSSPYIRDSYQIPAVTLGCQVSLLYRFVADNLDVVIFSLFSVFSCLLTLCAAGFFKLRKVEFDGSSLVFFTLFILVSSTWVITDCNILQLVTPNFPVVYFISHLTFMLIPLPLMIFLRKNTCYKPQGYGYLLLAYILGFLVRLGLFFGGVADLETSLPITHLLMGVGAVVSITLLAREWRLFRHRTALLFLIGFCALAACLGASLAMFFSHTPDYSLLLRIVLTLMMIAMFYQMFLEFETLAKRSIEGRLYQQLAYTDSLTGMLNRLAFQEQMAALEADPGCDSVCLIVFDIDRLKHANDTYGHSIGDELIRAAAENIHFHFASLGSCFRVGGDEFAVILKDFPTALLDEKLAQFQTRLAKVPLSTGEPLCIAAGYAAGSAQGAGFAHRLFDQADKAMYKNKTMQQ